PPDLIPRPPARRGQLLSRPHGALPAKAGRGAPCLFVRSGQIVSGRRRFFSPWLAGNGMLPEERQILTLMSIRGRKLSEIPARSVSLLGENIMARQRGRVRAGVLLGLLVLATPGRTDEAAAVKAIEKLGGEVVRDTKTPGKPVVRVDLGASEITDAGLKVLKDLKSLQKLDLGATKVTDAGLKELKELKSLWWLDLGGNKVSDVGLKELKALQRLEWLDLVNTTVTDAGLKELKELKDLRILKLSHTAITDRGLQELKAVESLQRLEFDDTAVTDAGLKVLRNLKHFEVDPIV